MRTEESYQLSPILIIPTCKEADMTADTQSQITTGFKVCTKCGRIKPRSEYHNDRCHLSGASRCKSCCSIKSMSEDDKQKRRELWRITAILRSSKIREYHKNNPQQGTEACRRWWAKNPAKYAAHKKIRDLVKRGKIEKPTHCSMCGKQEIARNIHGHHADYSKPLEVIWVCCNCHRKIHIKDRLEKGDGE